MSESPGFLLSPEESAAYLHLWKVAVTAANPQEDAAVSAAVAGPFLMKSRLQPTVLRDVSRPLALGLF